MKLKHACAMLGPQLSRPRKTKEMNAHLHTPLHVLAMAIALLRGLGEFASLQRWRLRERRMR
jgi:hypothetical protein